MNTTVNTKKARVRMTTHAGKILGKKLATFVGAATISLIGLSSTGHAQTITGFGSANATPNATYPNSGFSVNNGAWTVTNGGCCNGAAGMVAIQGTGSTLRLGFGGYDTGTAYYNTQVNVSQGFTASFTFNAPASGAGFGGFAFVIQNDARGLTAVGKNNGAMGWGATGDASGGVTQVQNSFAVGFGLSGGIEDQIGFSKTTTGDVANPMSQFSIASGLDLDSGANINAVITYDQPAGSLLLTLNGGSAITLAASGFNPTAFLGGNNGYIGFSTGSAGGANPSTITNFNLTTIPEPSTYALVLGSLGALALLRRRR